MSRRISDRDEYNDFISKWDWGTSYIHKNKSGKFLYIISTIYAGKTTHQLTVSYNGGKENHVTGGQSIHKLKKLAYFDFLRKTSHGRKLLLEKDI